MVPRFLGATDFGLFATAFVVNELVATLAGFGTDNYIVRTAARDPARTAVLVAHALVIRLVAWFAILALLIAVLAVASSDPRVPLLYAAIALSGAAALIHRGHIAGLQANLMLARAAIIVAIIGLASQAAVVGILVAGGGVLHLAYAAVAFSAASMTVSGIVLWRRFPPPARLHRSEIGSLLRAGRAFLSWDLAQLLFSRVDMVMLAVIAASATVGNYAFAYRVLSVPGILFTIIVAAVYPALAATAPRDRVWFRDALTNTGRLAILVSLPIAAGLAIVAGDITALFGGGEFDGAALLVVILAAHIPLAAIGTVLGAGLWSLDRQRPWAVVAWWAVGLNIGGNLVAIPLTMTLFDDGAIGACIVTVVTQVFMAVRAWQMIGDTVDRPVLLRAAGYTGAACLLMAAAIYALPGDAALPAKVAAGAAVFALSGALLRLVTVQDARFFVGAFRRNAQGA